MRLQLMPGVCTITYANCIGTGIFCQQQIMRGVANHQGTPRVHPGVIHDLLQHRRMRLGKGFIGAAGDIKQRRQAGMGQGPIQALAAFAGSHRQPETLLLVAGQCVTHTIEQFDFMITRQIIVAIEIHHLQIIRLLQIRIEVTHGIYQPKANHMPRPLI